MFRLLVTLAFCGLSQAATVYLSPPESLPSFLSPQQGNLVVTAHLGLEQFEVVNQQSQLNHLFRERDFVGKGDQSALLLVIDEVYARDVIPSTFEPSFSFSESASNPFSSFIKTCNQRASHVYAYVSGEPSVPTEGVPRTLDIFSSPTPENEAFLAEITTLVNYLDATPRSNHFVAFELASIPALAASHGRSSEQYILATDALRAAISVAQADTSVNLGLITHAPSSPQRRRLLDEQPVKTFSSCYSSLLDCTYATDDCSGHGECTNETRAGPSCFTCACLTTVSAAGKIENWAGERCERKDISGPFVLITGTVITLILLMGGSISLLYALNSHELPSILIGGVAGGARRE